MNVGPLEENPILFYKFRGEATEAFTSSEFMLVYMSSFQQHMLQTYSALFVWMVLMA